ncbi:6885_t:CDS:2, partial [Scutellospora calospora]
MNFIEESDDESSKSDDEKTQDTLKAILTDNIDDWKWPCFEEYFDQLNCSMQRKVMIESINICPFVVIYPRKGNSYVELSSQLLINVLRKILPKFNKSVENNECIKPTVAARDLFHALEKLKDTLETLTDMDGNVYLKRLIQFVEKEFKQTITNRKKMITNKMVSYKMLWVFYTENLEIWYRCAISGQQIGGIITSTKQTKFGFRIYIDAINYDSVGFKHCQLERDIDMFEGEVSFSDLPVVPIELSTAQDFLKESIIANGKQFFNLASGHHFMSYEGPLLRERNMRIEKFKADGRVMIDLQSFATMNPGYNMGYSQPPNKCDVKMLKEKNIYIKANDINKDSNYFLAPALVYGFSFTVKEWGLFEVSKFSDI